jgi:hypothetical protein
MSVTSGLSNERKETKKEAVKIATDYLNDTNAD